MVVEYKGKSDDAQIPPHLYKFMEESFPKEKVLAALNLLERITDEVLAERGWTNHLAVPKYTIYGEGYGVKIQNGGNYISNGVGFIVFDVKVNEW